MTTFCLFQSSVFEKFRSEADGGYSSALEDDGTQLAELARGLPPGARLSASHQ